VLLIAIFLGPIQAVRADNSANPDLGDVSGTLPMLTSNGPRIVDTRGNPVVLKGCNLGNWLMLESWMLGGCIQDGKQDYRDQAQLFRTLQRRFGQERFTELLDLYREGYIRARDFDLIKSYGFNVVRLPFDYRLLQSDQSPYALRPDAFRWLDHALSLAEAAHVYVILDMHGVPGGQSNQHHTGESGQNHLWHNDVNQQRTIDLWQSIAERYKTRSNVAAYDLINEPYGDYHTDERSELAALLPRIYTAIRSTGDQHIVFFPGALNGGIAFYGDPHSFNATNVGFTEHYYPGLFDGKVALESQARVLNQEFPIKEAYVQRLGVPYFVGEFNVVMESMGAGQTMRAYYDRFSEYGWAGTMWSYKLLTPAGGIAPNVWYMVTNARPMPRLDINSSSFEEFESFFRSFASVPLVANQPLLDALTTPKAPPLYLSNFPALPASAPSGSQSNPPGWTSVDIGPATPGYTNVQPDGTLVVYGGGTDIHGASDSCRFVSEAAQAPADKSAQIKSLLDSDTYAKAGIMARWGEQPGAPMAMVNVFPGGVIALINRPRPNAAATELKIQPGVRLPVELRLKVNSGRATGLYRDDAGTWKTIGVADVPANLNFRMGIAVCSHVDVALTIAKFRLGPDADANFSKPDAPAADASILKNGDFQIADGSSNLPAEWNHWGDGFSRATITSSAQPNIAPASRYVARINSRDAVGLWQEVSAEPGKRYAFSIYAQNISPELGRDARKIEVRLESATPAGQIILNTEKYDIAKLGEGSNWTRLIVGGTAISNNLRVLIITDSASQGRQGGGITLRDSALVPEQPD
jgi:endoglucanase